jgi:heme exporter protein A
MVADGALLEARALCAWRGERQVLRDVSFVLQPGDFLQVLGANGAGKSTLLRILCGLLPAESGDVRWRGSPVSSGSQPFSSELAYLGHLNAVKPELTAQENLQYLAGLRTRLTARDCGAALERVGLGGYAGALARTLSAGQKRRLALARLTIDAALLWILDEPATHLDVEGFGLVEELVRGHLGQGGIVVAAAHQRLLPSEPGMRILDLTA